MFCTVGLTTSAFSTYQPYMLEVAGMTNTQGSTVITVRSLFALSAMFPVGKYHVALGVRRGASLAALAAALSFFIYGVSSSFIGYCAAAAVSGVAYALGGMIPVSIIVGRWFHSHRALALGICAAGTGAASIAAPPLITALVEGLSLPGAFFCEGGFIAVSAAVIFAVLRDKPSDKGESPLGDSDNIVNARLPGCDAELRGASRYAMLLAMALIGAVANPGLSHLSVLYRLEGFSPSVVSLLLSFVGIALTAGKCLYGTVTDRLGSYRAGYRFFSLLIAGNAVSCLAGLGSKPTAFCGMALLGMGLPIATVGISVIAGDMSTPERYGLTLRRFQTAYMVGALAFGPVPGLVADLLGSYVPAYIVLTAFSAASMVLVQLTYRKMERGRGGLDGG